MTQFPVDGSRRLRFQQGLWNFISPGTVQ